jgi:hypothetical protein
MNLATYLKKRSKEICKDNECTEDNHNCESYAYIDQHGNLLDICISDYFQGHAGPYAAVMLPWSGSQMSLDKEVKNQCADFEE